VAGGAIAMQKRMTEDMSKAAWPGNRWRVCDPPRGLARVSYAKRIIA
jgi:hypothetical protein